MKNAVIARRYAVALLELASESHILASVTSEVAAFEQNLQTTPGFRLFLVSQSVSKAEKRAKIETILQDRASNVFVNFLLVLLKKNRESIFSDIAREYQALVDQRQKRTRAAATTAVPMDDKAITQLKSVLDKAFDSDVQIDSDVDPSILGGIIVNVGGQLLDGSLRSQLQRLKTQLVENTDSN